MRQLSTRVLMTQKLTTIGHRTVFNNDQSTYRSQLLLFLCKKFKIYMIYKIKDDCIYYCYTPASLPEREVILILPPKNRGFNE